ncbi:cytochrome C [Arcobacter sp.]|uniref:cytochrome C n=1 Tax=Arcobacter sp. TaxID=1872629 RepID=UPI003C754BAC
MKKFLLVIALMLGLSLSYVWAAEKKIDPKTGLIIAPGFEEVKTNCTACHSAKFITAQRGDRETWLSMIRWMQKTQGLWEFSPKLEDTILDYLSKNYPPGEATRRPNLKPSAMPQNPYEK